MNLRVRPGWLLVRRAPAPDQTKSGLHLPPEAQERPQLAEVVATSTTEIPVGTTVLLPKFHESLVHLDNLEMIKERDVLAVVSA